MQEILVVHACSTTKVNIRVRIHHSATSLAELQYKMQLAVFGREAGAIFVSGKTQMCVED